MNIKNILLNKYKSFIYSRKGGNFEKRFNFLNKLVMQYPIKIEYDKSIDLYEIKDKYNLNIYLSVPARVERFNHGISHRLDYLINEYMVNNIGIKNGDIIIDVGANIGEFTMGVQRKWDVTIIAIEPEKKEYECLCKNTKQTNTTTENIALYSKPGEMTIYSKNSTNDTSLFKIENYESKRNIYVDTLDNVIDKLKINDSIKLLKLEAEGAEPEILMGAKRSLKRIEFVTADCGPERGLNKETTLVQVTNILKDNNFDLINYYHKRDILLFKNKTI